MNKKPRYLKHRIYTLEYLRFCKWIEKENKKRKEMSELNFTEYTPIAPFTNSQKKFATWLLKKEQRSKMIIIGNMTHPFDLVRIYSKSFNGA